MQATQDNLKHQFERGMKDTPHYNTSDQVWLSTKAKQKHSAWMAGTLGFFKTCINLVLWTEFSLPNKGVHPIYHFTVLKKHKTKTIVEKMQPTPNLVEVNSKDQGEGECILDSHRQFKNLKYLITWPRFILSTPHGWVQFWEICIKGCISFFKISEQNLKILKKKKRRVKGGSAFQNGSPMLLWKEHQPNKRYLGS